MDYLKQFSEAQSTNHNTWYILAAIIKKNIKSTKIHDLVKNSSHKHNHSTTILDKSIGNKQPQLIETIPTKATETLNYNKNANSIYNINFEKKNLVPSTPYPKNIKNCE